MRVLLQHAITDGRPTARLVPGNDEAVGVRLIDCCENLGFIFDFLHHLNVRVLRKRRPNDLSHQARLISDENSNFFHMPPKREQVWNGKEIREGLKAVQGEERLDRYQVQNRTQEYSKVLHLF